MFNLIRTGASEAAVRQTFSTPTVRVDAKRGVLYVQLRETQGPVRSMLDDEEVFVFQDMATGAYTGFTVPHYTKYWAARQEELASHLGKYSREAAVAIASLYRQPTRQPLQKHTYFREACASYKETAGSHLLRACG
jgi:hypothetical protein